MKTLINNTNYQNLIKGASIFTTGGGIPFEDQLESLKGLKSINLSLQSLDEFPKDSIICTAAELGPTDVPPLKKIKVIKRMRDLLSNAINKPIAGLYPPEIGQESVVIESSHYLNLPIADFDPVGFRAVPYIDINIFNLLKLRFNYTPMAVSTDRDEIFLVEGPISYERLETILRSMTSFSKLGVVFLLGGALNVNKLIENKLERPSFSKALTYGEIKNVNQLLKMLKPKIVIEAKVVGKKEFDQKGFLGEIVTVKDKEDKIFRLIVLNEVLFVLDKNSNLLAAVPERILLLDPNEPRGISGVFLEKNVSLLIVVIPPEKEWGTKNAHTIFGKERFMLLFKNLSLT